MKPQEFEKIVRAKTPVVESAPEPIVEATPAPVLKSMDITSINQQYHALLGESSLRGFAPGENSGGTEAYTMEDEELDGMALGELQAIAQAAKKIFASVKRGVPLEAWMYKKITNGNEGLTAVAQQINNPAVREQPGVAEGLNDTQKKIEDTINKLEDRLKHAKSDEQWDRISARIERLQVGLKRSKQGVAEGSDQPVGYIDDEGKLVTIGHKPGFAKSVGHANGGWIDTGRAIPDSWKAVYTKNLEQGVAEGSLNEFAIDKEPNGDNRSKLIGTIVQLLKSGKKVDFYVPGIRGHVVGSGGNGDWLTLKRWNKPYSKINYSLELDASDDSRFSLKMIKPDYYQVVQSEDMNQGVAEGSISDLLNKDPKSPKFNDHSAPRKTKHSGSTPTPYEQGRLDAHRKKSYNNIHNTEQDAEDYKTGYRHVKSRQGVAEGSTTRGGFGGSASQAQHEIQWLKNKIETLKPLLAKKPSVARQIKDLERQIRERELAIAYQKEDVAEGLPQTLRKVVPGYAKREIDRKMDAGKFGKTDADKDANFQRYKKIQDKLKKQGVAEGIFDRFKKKQPAKPQRMPITDEQRAAIIQHFPTNHNANLKWGRKENDDYVLPDNVTVQFGKSIINFINYDGNLIASVAYYRSKEDRMNPKAIPLTHFDKPINSDKDLEQLKSNLVEGSLNEFAPDGFDGFEGDDRVPMHFIVEKDSYNPRSKWKKSYKPQGGGIALFTTKQEAIQAAEKFNKLDPNREFKYGGTQLVHVEDDDKQLDEFAPGNGDDDDFDPETANMAHQEGVVKGFSLVDGATVEQALQIPHCQWGKLYNGQYKQYFVKGFIDGRKAKLEQARKDGVELSLQKDGSLSRVQQGVAEGWIDDDAAEPLAKYFADLYYGDFSVTMKIKLAAHIYQSIQNGELTIEQLKAEIDMLEKEKGIKEQGVAEGSYDNDKGITHTRGSLVAKLEALPKGSDDFEWNRIQAIHQLKQGNMLRAKYYMALMKRSKQGVAEGSYDDDDTSMSEKLHDLLQQGMDYKQAVNLVAKTYNTYPEYVVGTYNRWGNHNHDPYDDFGEQGVAEGNVEKTTTGLKHTRDYEYPTKGREFNKDLDRLNKTQTGILDKALGVEWTPTNKRKEITGDQTGVAENFEPGETKRVLKSGGKPAGEIGLDPEASPGNGAYYIKHYASGKDLGGYDTYQEALEELRYIDKQYQHANRPADTRSKHQKMMDNPAYAEGYRDGKRGVTGKNVADIFGPMSDVYHRGYKAGKQGVTEGLTEIKKGQKDSNGYTKCWPGKHAEGTKKGKNGGQVRNCVPNESVEQDPNDPQWSKKYNKDVGESTTKIPTGLKHHGDYGSKYPPEEYRDEYGHRVRGQKYVPGHEENEYDHRGRPPKAPLAKVELPADAFGRVSGKVPKGKQGIRISGKSNTDESTDYASAVNNLLNEFAGGMGVSSVAVGPGAMKNPAKTGSLFGGSYTQKNSPFKKKATKKESVIKR